MPELPELQAHAERLTTAFVGAVLVRLEPLTFTALKTFDPAPERAADSPLRGVGRRGKHLLLEFGAQPAGITFVAHLMQGGRLRADDKGSRNPRGGIARWRFADGRMLLLTEPGTERKAGVWVVAGDARGQAPLDHLGPEADTVDPAAMAQLFAGHSMRLHTFLRDQRILAGLGRRLANEICWGAKLSPFAQTRTLGAADADTLVQALRTAVAGSLVVERGRDDLSASRERSGAVHNRVGEACPRCGSTIRAVEYRDYTVAYCPQCQTGGKVLADNTTSKFLK